MSGGLTRVGDVAQKNLADQGWKIAAFAFAFWVCGGGLLLALGAWDGRKQWTRDACAAATILLAAGSYVLAQVLAARGRPS